ncbi:uncharacterized protein LOC118557933 [Fundulus heteroclitus]|uniref:uncharacterized protein LOC118557933 n=1 Tax=Fundulus heteroclitus TaxID=8078 RepID=UPI00165BDC5F|nr:uncharacterized protein LOC118557933 [Fundulus heteroclitus]
MWFDERMTWGVHIKKIIDKCRKVLNIMRCLVGTEWGADRKSLKAIYTGLIRSVLDYGCIVYNSAADTNLHKLNIIQHQALRICTGAFKTSSTAALQVEMGEMPLKVRRDQLSLNYWSNLQGQRKDHPTLEVLKPGWEKEKKQLKSFGWVIKNKVNEMNLNQLDICQTVPLTTIPPWILPDAKVDLALLEKKEKEKYHIMNKYIVLEHLNKYYNYIQIYTDASKNTSNRVGIAFIIPQFHIKIGKRISDGVSVYTGEMLALLLAVQWVEEVRPLKSIICSDSSSSLISLQNNQSDSRPDILIEIQQTLYRINMMGLVVNFVWVPAHNEIKGNEMADRMAKESTNKVRVDINVSFGITEIKGIIKQKAKDRWQKLWDEERKGRWLYKIQKRIGQMRITERNRREEIIISRLRMGHTGLNRSLFLIGKHQTGKCDCGEDETVEHVILNCNKYWIQRNRLTSKLSNMKIKLDIVDLLRKESGSRGYQVIFEFLKQSRLYNRI